eukprot:g2823.t1
MGGIWIWNYTTGEGVYKLKTNVPGSMTSLSTVRTPEYISIIGCENGDVYLINVIKDCLVKKLSSMSGSVQCLNWISTYVHHLSVDLEVTSLSSPVDEKAPVKLTIMPAIETNNDILILGSADGSVQIWSYALGEFNLLETIKIPVHKKTAPQNWTWNVCKMMKLKHTLSPTPDYTITLLASIHGALYSWALKICHHLSKSVEIDTPIALPKIHNRIIFTLDFLPDPNSSILHFITSSMDRKILLWRVENNQWKSARIVSSMDCLGGDVLSLDSVGSKYLASGNADKTVKVLDLESTSLSELMTRIKTKWRGIASQVTLVKWSPDLRCLAFVCKDRTLGLFGEKDKYYIYPTKTKQPVCEIQWRVIPRGTGSMQERKLIILDSNGALFSYPMIYESEFLDNHDEDRGPSHKRADNSDNKPTRLTSRIQDLSSSGGRLSTFLMSSSGRYLVAGTDTGHLTLIELVDDRFEDSTILLNTLDVFSNTTAIHFLEWNRNERKILVLGENGNLAVLYWSGEDQIFVNSRLNQSGLSSAHWSLHQSFIIYTLHNDKEIKLWDVSHYSPIMVLNFNCVQNQKLTLFASHPKKQDTVLLASASPCLIEQKHEHVEKSPQYLHQFSEQTNEVTVRIKFKYPGGNRVIMELITNTNGLENKSSKKKTPQKRNPLSLKKTPLVSFQKNQSNLKQFIHQVPLLLTSDPDRDSMEVLWKEIQSFGLYKTPSQAASGLREQITDKDSPETKAVKLLWLQEYQEAAEVLFSKPILALHYNFEFIDVAHGAMTGEFLPFFVPGGGQFYTSIVEKYADYLESIEEPHLASLHLMTIGKVSKAIEVYQKSGLYNTGVCLASLKYLKEDQEFQNAFWKRAIGTQNQTPLAAALDMLIANKPKEAIQVLLAARDSELDLIGAKIVAALTKGKLMSPELDPSFLLTVLRRALVHCTVSNEDSQMIRGLIQQLKQTQLCNSDILFCDVLGEVLTGQFTDLLSNLCDQTIPTNEILNAGLTALVSFKRCYELLNTNHQPQAQPLINDLDQTISQLQDQRWTDAHKQANEICKWFIFELFGFEDDAMEAQIRLKAVGLVQKDNLALEHHPHQNSVTNCVNINETQSVIRYTKNQLLELETNPGKDRKGSRNLKIPKAFRFKQTRT